jgi:hypothetical protein
LWAAILTIWAHKQSVSHAERRRLNGRCLPAPCLRAILEIEVRRARHKVGVRVALKGHGRAVEKRRNLRAAELLGRGRKLGAVTAAAMFMPSPNRTSDAHATFIMTFTPYFPTGVTCDWIDHKLFTRMLPAASSTNAGRLIAGARRRASGLRMRSELGVLGEPDDNAC